MAGAAAGIEDVGTSGKKAQQYEYRITGYFVFSCLLAALGGSLFGYDLGISGGVTSMDDFLKEFFPGVYKRKRNHIKETDYCKYDNQILTLFTSSLYFSGLLSTFAASYVTRNKGRRVTIILGSLTFFLGALLNASSFNISMLIFGRIFLGIGIGFGNQAVPLYLSEMAPARIRGAVNQLFQLTTCLGILTANLINYITETVHPWGWRLSLGLAAAPALVMLMGAVFLPETPNGLVEQGRVDECRRVLEKVRGTSRVDVEFSDLVEAAERGRADPEHRPLRNLFRRRNLPELLVGGIALPAFQQLTGMNSILFYSPVIFQSLGFGSRASLYSSVMTSGALVLATFVSMALVDRFGRRAFFLEAGCEMVAVAITTGRELGEGKKAMGKGTGVFLVVMICMFVMAYGRSWGPLGWLVPSEMFPLETRSAGQSVVVCVNLIFTSLIAQCFLVSLCHFRYGIFLIFAAFVAFMTAFVYFFLPETSRVPIEEVKFLWRKHWFWRRVVGKEKEEAITTT